MAVEQQIVALNLQLGEANSQIGLMAIALDTLRNESSVAIQELRRMLAQASPVGGGIQKKEKEVSFINVKVFEGGKFNGGSKESLKTWAKKIRIFLNSQHRGMRRALEFAEEAANKVNIADLGITDREFATDANEKLHDFLMTHTAEEGLQVVEPYGGEGFEAWRQLKLRYTSSGGSTEIDRTVRLFSKRHAKTWPSCLPPSTPWTRS